MSESITDVQYFVDKNSASEITTLYEKGQEIAKLVLNCSTITIDMANVLRKPRYDKHRKENNAEHSFMLGLAGMSITEQFFPQLDSGLMVKFAHVHDLVELETGDIPTFDIDDKALEAKKEAEDEALHTLERRLDPILYKYLVRYEKQEEPEALLTRHIDKLLPYAVDITGKNNAGVYMMFEEDDITSSSQLLQNNTTLEERFDRMFPYEDHKTLRMGHTILALTFAMQFPK